MECDKRRFLEAKAEEKTVEFKVATYFWNALYITETGRVLAVRIKEHLVSKRRRNLTSPPGRQRDEGQGGTEFDVKCMVLTFETKSVEALLDFCNKSRT